MPWMWLVSIMPNREVWASKAAIFRHSYWWFCSMKPRSHVSNMLFALWPKKRKSLSHRMVRRAKCAEIAVVGVECGEDPAREVADETVLQSKREQ